MPMQEVITFIWLNKLDVVEPFADIHAKQYLHFAL